MIVYSYKMIRAMLAFLLSSTLLRFHSPSDAFSPHNYVQVHAPRSSYLISGRKVAHRYQFITPSLSHRTTATSQNRIFMSLDNLKTQDTDSKLLNIDKNDVDDNGDNGSSSTTYAKSPQQLKAIQEAKQLQEQAKKVRLEAERMNTILTLEKIQNLELQLKKTKLQQDQVNDSDSNAKSNTEILKKDKILNDQMYEIQRQIDYLRKSLDGDSPTAVSKKSTSTVSTIPSSTTSNDTKKTFTQPPKLSNSELQKRIQSFRNDFDSETQMLFMKAVNMTQININNEDDLKALNLKIYEEEEKQKILAEEFYKEQKERQLSEKNMGDDNNPIGDKSEFNFPLSDLDKAAAYAGFKRLPPIMKEIVASQLGLNSAKNVTEVVSKLEEVGKLKRGNDGIQFFLSNDDDEENIDVEIDTSNNDLERNSTKSTSSTISTAFNDKVSKNKNTKLSGSTKERAIDLFGTLPKPMQFMLAKNVGLDDVKNITAVIDKLEEQGKVKPNGDGVEFLLYEDADGEDAEGEKYIKTILPEATRKVGQGPTEKDVDVLLSQVLGRKNFNPTSKPEAIPGGYIIRGENMMKSNSEMIEAIENALQKTELDGKIQCFYIKDPTPVTEEKFENETYELPLLLVTGSNLSPSTNPFVKPLISLLGLFAAGSFSLGCFLFSGQAVQGNEIDLLKLKELATPLFVSMFLPQIAHEIAHFVIGLKNKIKIGPPTVVPSLQLGIQGCITPIKSPPEDLNSLFDFALAGPLTGMFVSLFLLYAGLENQVFMDVADQSLLPSVPIELIKSSSLGGGMIEWLLGNGILLSPDPSASFIRLHPYAITGFLGIVTNALNLLPIGNTDGGRIALTLFGRNFANFIRSMTLLILVIAGIFGGDDSNVLLYYAIIVSFFQREVEIPCKNEIDAIDDTRVFLAFATAVLVGLALVPLNI